MANLLILESPAGVGYSYCGAGDTPTTNCSNTDITTAANARSAVANFFKEKFPSLSKNDFAITGESYAGVYVLPTFFSWSYLPEVCNILEVQHYFLLQIIGVLPWFEIS